MDPEKQAYVLDNDLLSTRQDIVPLPFEEGVTVPKNAFIEVPHFNQQSMYGHFAACIQMVFAYYGRHVDQDAIMRISGLNVLNQHTDPPFGTNTIRENVCRVATCFNMLALSRYPFQYASVEEIARDERRIADIDENALMDVVGNYRRPLIVRMRERRGDDTVVSSVYDEKWRTLVGYPYVVVGYDEHVVIVHDPWDTRRFGGNSGGPNQGIPWSEFHHLWVNSCRAHMSLLQPAVVLHADQLATYPEAGKQFDFQIGVRHSVPYHFRPNAPILRNVVASLDINDPEFNCSLMPGQHPVMPIHGGTLDAEQFDGIRWNLAAGEEGSPTKISVKVSADVHGNSPYQYTSRISEEYTRTIPRQ